MSLGDIKKLREATSLGINECRKALDESGGDFDKALKILKNKGIKMLEKRGARDVNQGAVDSYIHFGGNLGSLVEVNCETDFVARTEVFKKFVKDMAMQVAAANPEYVNRDDINAETSEGIENVDVYAKQYCLMDQPYIKDNSMLVRDYLQNVIAQTGENIVIKRFVRFSIG